MWETAAGRLVGVVHAEYPGDVFLELHPDYRSLEVAMVAWAEAHFSAPRAVAPGRELRFYVHEYDIPRRRLLTARGYEKTAQGGMFRRMRLGHGPLPASELPVGYTLRSLRPGDEGDYQRLADVLTAGFNRTGHTAAEARAFVTGAPSFRSDLHLVAALPDDRFAAHIGFTLDANRRGIVEPVCTHPAHLRKGLARALMAEGLRRLQALGAVEVTVDTGDAEAANTFYDAVGFTEGYKGYIWRKQV
jgi:GNAT superfamily N-acetyltransferase